MYIDLDKVEDQTRFESTVCIIGAGIAGLLLARKLASRGIDVHLLEAGGSTLEPRSQEMYNVQMEGRYHQGATEGRYRVFGGSSTRWGGQLLPYTPEVFNPPSGSPSAAWPVTNADVEPHYAELRKMMQVPDCSPDLDCWKSLEREQVSDCPDIQVRFSQWAPFSKRNLAKTIGKECLDSRSVTVFFHANATSIEVAKTRGGVERIVAKNYAGKSHEFHARHFVVCVGTIESCRLLLASRSGFECGVGNAEDQVGRFFHDHISVAAATLPVNARREFVRLFAPLLLEGTLHTPKLEASPSLRRSNRLLAVMAHFAIEEPEGSGIAAGRDLLRHVQQGRGLKELPKALLALPYHSAEIARVLWCAWVRKRRAVSDRATITLRLDSEQLPCAESRIRLSTERDALGMPRAILDWRVSAEEHRTVQVYGRVVDRFLCRLGVAPLQWRPELWRQDDSWLKLTRDTYHHMGGTRMGRDPESSVVDPDLQVHGLGNLFVASCSVFPGGGSSNPTFTLMALTLRLAAHLAKLCSVPVASYQSKDQSPYQSKPVDLAVLVPQAIAQD
jgi:choline dehydrogenase-like flavoprotein